MLCAFWLEVKKKRKVLNGWADRVESNLRRMVGSSLSFLIPVNMVCWSNQPWKKPFSTLLCNRQSVGWFIIINFLRKKKESSVLFQSEKLFSGDQKEVKNRRESGCPLQKKFIASYKTRGHMNIKTLCWSVHASLSVPSHMQREK